MKNPKISRNQPAITESVVSPLTPRSDPSLESHSNAVILHIGGRRYEMTLHSEIREITKGPAKVIEMPPRSAGKR